MSAGCIDSIALATRRWSSAQRRHQLGMTNLANLVVRELEAAADLVEDAPAHQLLHAIGRLLIAEAGRALEQGELESPPDDGGHIHQVATAIAEPAHAFRDEG